MSQLDDLCWTSDRAGEVLAALASACDLDHRVLRIEPGELTEDPGELRRRVERFSDALGIEALLIEERYPAAAHLARLPGPLLLSLPDLRLLAIVAQRARHVVVLAPNLRRYRLGVSTIRNALCRDLEAEAAPVINALCDRVDLAGRRKIFSALMTDHLRARTLPDAWRLRPAVGGSFREQLRHARAGRQLTLLALAHGLQYLLALAGVLLVGRGALNGQVNFGWLVAWSLLLLTVVPFELMAMWVGGTLSIDIGGLLKRRLMAGMTRLPGDEIRREGAGMLIGRVMESQQVESLSIDGGLAALVTTLDLALAFALLTQGAGGAWHAVLLLGWIALGAALVGRYAARYRAWAAGRLEVTQELVEQMLGHRTRLAQQPPSRWYSRDDDVLSRYTTTSANLDSAAVWMNSLVPRGWVVVGLAALVPTIVGGRASPSALAVSAFGVLVAYRALATLLGTVSGLVAASVSWTQAAPLFHAAARPTVVGSPAVDPAPPDHVSGEVVLDARDIGFRHRGKENPTLRSVSLQIRSGDRLLLEGGSGSGKSTLAAVLAGLREPQSGVLLADGLDRATLGEQGWRRRLVLAPQFHENHIFFDTLAFNLLMGRRWPATEADLVEAGEVCEELGLGELIRKMPAGLMEIVGEMGWQLSHGERSRVYIARALLQGANVVILDESLGPLDPATHRQVLRCVMERAATLVVIAHP